MARDRSEAGGWIHLWRSVRDSRFHFTKERRAATRHEAREDLWLSAAFEDDEVLSGHQFISVKRGDVLTSVYALADRWRWNRDRVRTFLDMLVTMGEVTLKPDTKRTIVTICNYPKWNDASPTNRTTGPLLAPHASTTVRHVEESEESEETKKLKKQNGRPYVTESLGNGGNGNGRNRAEMSDDRELQAIKVVAHCQHTAERVVHHKLADLDAVPKMRKLLTVRDAETVSEVFDHFAVTRRKPSTFNFHNFFAYYTEHEQETINDLPEEEP